jgi:hypothetical protein
MTEKQFKEECLRRVKVIAEELDRLVDNGKTTNLREYFEDALDVVYSVDRYGDYRRVAVTITTGGPHIEVDTDDRAVKLWWGDEEAQWSINRNTAEAIDDIFAEYYQALR